MTGQAASSHHDAHRAKRLTIFVKLRDRAGRHLVYFEILKRARRAKIGATVFQGSFGYGQSGRTHQTRLMVDDSPQSIVIVEQPERIDALLDEIDELIYNLVVIVEDVDVIET